jgi:hypothetical protein
MSNKQKGLSVLRLLIIIAVICLVVGGGFILLNKEKAKARDAKRLSDMARLQAAFELLYNETASYAGASQSGCDAAGVLVSTCNLTRYIPAIGQMGDPGKFSYKVTTVPSAEGYVISFYLEASYGNLRSGKHTLSPAGIK